MPRGPKVKDKEQKTPLAGIPDPPKDLDATAKRHWREVTVLLDDAGLASKLDRDSLTVYCERYALYRQAKEQIKVEGAVITAKNGYRQPNPWYTISVQCLKEMQVFMDRFGLSPKARSVLVTKEQDEIDPEWLALERNA